MKDEITCSCGWRLEHASTIDGPNHPGDHQLVRLDLYQCSNCGRRQLRTEKCTHFDFTGCNDEYEIFSSVIDAAGLVTLLLELDEDLKQRPAQSFGYGRKFQGSLAWAEEYGDPEIIQLLRASTEPE